MKTIKIRKLEPLKTTSAVYCCACGHCDWWPY